MKKKKNDVQESRRGFGAVLSSTRRPPARGPSVFGPGLSSVPGGPDYLNRTVMSWHYYCWLGGVSAFGPEHYDQQTRDEDDDDDDDGDGDDDDGDDSETVMVMMLMVIMMVMIMMMVMASLTR